MIYFRRIQLNTLYKTLGVSMTTAIQKLIKFPMISCREVWLGICFGIVGGIALTEMIFKVFQ